MIRCERSTFKRGSIQRLVLLPSYSVLEGGMSLHAGVGVKKEVGDALLNKVCASKSGQFSDFHPTLQDALGISQGTLGRGHGWASLRAQGPQAPRGGGNRLRGMRKNSQGGNRRTAS